MIDPSNVTFLTEIRYEDYDFDITFNIGWWMWWGSKDAQGKGADYYFDSSDEVNHRLQIGWPVWRET